MPVDGCKDASFESSKSVFTDKRCIGSHNDTPLHLAAAEGNLDEVKRLVLQVKADPNTRGKADWTPLHVAAHFGEYRVVEWLVSEAKADIHATNVRGHTPLYLASVVRCYDSMRFLISKGACRHVLEEVAMDPDNINKQLNMLIWVAFMQMK